MRLVIDLQGAQTEGSRNRGIGRYSLAIATGLARTRGEHEVLIALNGAYAETIEPIRTAFRGLLAQECIHVWTAPQPAAFADPANDARRYQAELMREAFLAELEPDWVLLSSCIEGYEGGAVTGVELSQAYRTAVILYDLIPWIHADIYLGNERQREWYFSKIDELRRADLLLGISASSGREAVDHLGFEPERVVNVSTAADEFFHPVELDDEHWRHLSSAYGIQPSFLMYTGGIDFRKNVERLVAAYARLPGNLRASHQLVIVCSVEQSQRDHLLSLARSFGLGRSEMVLTGFVPEDDLLLLYNACTLFVFPSWHEGFGIPALEAMQCGRPAIAGNRSSLPEVVGWQDALFDPYDIADIAGTMERALTDRDFYRALLDNAARQADSFSWEETSLRAWSAMASAPAREQPLAQPRRHRPRLAYVSPLPPERSGIADYSAELLPELTRHYRVDVVLREPEALADDYIRASCGVLSTAAFRANAHSYDRVLYHFGNSVFHDHMFGLLSEIPGVVVLHDVFLSGILAYCEFQETRPHMWARALLDSHGYTAVRQRFSEPDAAKERYPASLSVIQDALGVIVHSEHSRTLIGRWYGTAALDKTAQAPLLRVAEAEVHQQEARERLGLAEDALVVATFGILAGTKLNHRLLDAWLASTLADNPSALLVFVGEAGGDYGENIARRIQQAGAGDRIRITGWADRSAYRDWLTAADIGVQLRTASRGETAASVLDCMNFELATIVNAHGSLAELEADAVWKLPDEFSDEELIDALEVLAASPERRLSLRTSAREILRTRHGPRQSALRYVQLIEEYHARSASHSWQSMQRIAMAADSASIADLATRLAQNHPPVPRLFQCLLDITGLLEQRGSAPALHIVRSLLLELLDNPPEGFRIEPVLAVSERGEYRYARRDTCRLLDIPSGWAEDCAVDVWPGDVFLGLGLDKQSALKQRRLWQDWRARGIQVSQLVFSPQESAYQGGAPIAHPQLDTQWIDALSCASVIIASSRSLASEIQSCEVFNGLEEAGSPTIDWLNSINQLEVAGSGTCFGEVARELWTKLQTGSDGSC